MISQELFETSYNNYIWRDVYSTFTVVVVNNVNVCKIWGA